MLQGTPAPAVPPPKFGGIHGMEVGHLLNCGPRCGGVGSPMAGLEGEWVPEGGVEFDYQIRAT